MGILVQSTRLLFIFLICTAATCSVKLGDINIPVYAETFYIPQLANNAYNAPPDLGIDFAEKFKDKVRRETRLVYSDLNPHLEFDGAIQDFNVTAVAPQPGEVTQFSRLTIRIKIDFYDTENEEENWSQTFSHDVDFPSDQNLLDVQDDLVEQIFEQISQDIFQKAFGKW